MDKWNEWYKDLDPASPGSYRYGETITYRLGYEFLKDCNEIEDWGCGTGGFKRFINPDDKINYIGVDGSITPHSNIKADLTKYTSNVMTLSNFFSKTLHSSSNSLFSSISLAL
jgi:hypothetical protein